MVLTGLLVVLIAFFAPWFSGQRPSSELTLIDEQEKVTSLQPTSTAAGISWQVFSQTGQLSYQLGAARLQQFADQNYATIIGPSVQIQDQQRRPWQINAARGKISQGNPASDEDDQIELFENVQLTQIQRAKTGGGLSIETSQLSIYPNRKRAFTDQPVVVSHPRFTTKSNGLDLDLQTGTLRFVRGDATRVVSKLFLHNHYEAS